VEHVEREREREREGGEERKREHRREVNGDWAAPEEGATKVATE